MNTAPLVQEPRGGGCGKGCTIFLGLIIFLAIALVGGTFWAFHHFRETYSATEPLQMPAADEADVESMTQTAPVPLPGAPSATAPDPIAAVATGGAETRWDAFEKAAKRNQKAQIILSAGDINSLLQGDPDLAGKGSVSIQNNIGRVQVSIPLEGVFMMDGRYLNGAASVEASPDGNPGSARIFDITIGGKKVPDGVLDQQMFGWPSVRTMISDWLNEQDISSFKIENNRVLGQTRG